MTEDFDLFGNPYIAKPTKRGRPPHEVTKKTRSRVSMLVALGWTNPRIAAVLDITLPTPSTGPIEVRVMVDGDDADEAIALQRLEIFIQ